MKQFILLLTVFWMLLKPLWPVAEYIVNYNYIATVLCENKEVPEMKCNGKCYLSKLLAKEKQQRDKNPFESTTPLGDQLPIILTEIRDIQLSAIGFGNGVSRPEDCVSDFHDCQFVFELIQPPEA